MSVPHSAFALFRSSRRLLAAVAVGALLAGPARAQEFSVGTVLDDTEIGATLSAYARPLLIAGGLQPDNVALHMIVDDSMNAFATQGNNVYFHTGLLLRA